MRFLIWLKECAQFARAFFFPASIFFPQNIMFVHSPYCRQFFIFRFFAAKNVKCLYRRKSNLPSPLRIRMEKCQLWFFNFLVIDTIKGIRKRQEYLAFCMKMQSDSLSPLAVHISKCLTNKQPTSRVWLKQLSFLSHVNMNQLPVTLGCAYIQMSDQYIANQ